jgi:hypothetical protein
MLIGWHSAVLHGKQHFDDASKSSRAFSTIKGEEVSKDILESTIRSLMMLAKMRFDRTEPVYMLLNLDVAREDLLADYGLYRTNQQFCSLFISVIPGEER